MTLIKDALAYRHFVFIDISTNRHNSEFKGSVCKINGKIYRLMSKDDKLYFRVLNEDEIQKDRITSKHIMILNPNERIGLIIYNNQNTHYEYVIPNEILDKFFVE